MLTIKLSNSAWFEVIHKELTLFCWELILVDVEEGIARGVCKWWLVVLLGSIKIYIFSLILSVS